MESSVSDPGIPVHRWARTCPHGSGAAGPARAVVAVVAVIALLTAVVAAPARGQVADAQRIPAADPQELIEIVKRTVWPNLDLVTRMAAQKRLQKLGREQPHTVVALLVSELSGPRQRGEQATHQRLALIETLRDIGPAAQDAVPILIEILNDPDEPNEWVGMAARMALDRIGGPDARKAASSGDRRRAEDQGAAGNSRDRQRAARHSAFLIRQQLRRPRPGDRIIAASLNGLRGAGPLPLPALTTLMRVRNDPRLGTDIRAEANRTIAAANPADADRAAGSLGPSSEVDPFEDLLADVADDDDFIRQLAMAELGRLGPSPRAIEVLIDALSRGRSPGAAANALGDYGARARAAVNFLAPYFADPTFGVNAIQAVGKIGIADDGAISALRRIVRTDGHANRGYAAKTISRLGVRDALPDLQTALTDRRKYTRILAVNAIASFGVEAADAVADLSLRLEETDTDVRRAVIDALGRIGPPAQPAAALIARDLQGGDDRLRQAAERALAKIGGPAAGRARDERAQAHFLTDKVAARNLVAGGDNEGMARLLRTLPAPRARVLARELVEHENTEIALIAALALVERTGDDFAIARLVQLILVNDQGPRVLTGIGFSQMHGGTTISVQTLRKILAQLEIRLRSAPPAVQQRFEGLLTR